MKNTDKDNFIGYVVLVLGVGMLMSVTSGCAGVELGGKLGIYRVDSRRESQETYRNAVPLKCYFVACPTAQEEAATEAEGS